MYWAEFLTVALIHLLAVASPGPDFAIVVRESVAHGRRAGTWTAVGVGTGIFVHVAYSLLGKVLEEFLIKLPKSIWQAQARQLAASGQIPPKGEGIVRTSEFPYAQDYLARYQDPRQADTILRVQQELDDTKIVLHNTIDSVLQRGEDLDKLVEKSGSLSQQSKMFYKSAKKQNSCCGIM